MQDAISFRKRIIIFMLPVLKLHGIPIVTMVFIGGGGEKQPKQPEQQVPNTYFLIRLNHISTGISKRRMLLFNRKPYFHRINSLISKI